MEMKLASPTEVENHMIRELGLDPNHYAATSLEVLAASVRRAIALTGPVRRRSIIRMVTGAFDGLVEDDSEIEQRVEMVVDQLLDFGDLAEVAEENELTGAVRSFLHPAPPSFVRRKSGSVLLLGIASDNTLPIPDRLREQVYFRGCARILREEGNEDRCSYLEELGFVELSHDTWLRGPQRCTAREHLDELNAHLDGAPSADRIPELSILDPEKPVNYYKGRWTSPTSQTGRFVARRPQKYGSRLWCFVELSAGCPRRLLDLPLDYGMARGCDEAWRLSAAIDAVRGTPQRCGLTWKPGGQVLLELFGPVPRWAERRWHFLGEQVAVRGAFPAFALPEEEADEELKYIREELWLECRIDR